MYESLCLPQNSYFEILMPIMMLLGSGTFTSDQVIRVEPS